MNDLLSNLSILWPALLAGFIVVLSHVPMGQQVLARGIVFIDLAVAQVAGLGVIAAHGFGLEMAGWTTQIAAVAAALLAALLLTWTERRRPEAQEALRLDPGDPDIFVLLASIELAQRNWPAALAAAEQALALDPEHVNAANLRSMALVRLGRKSEAMATVDHALHR